jgi:hypothetical protein
VWGQFNATVKALGGLCGLGVLSGVERNRFNAEIAGIAETTQTDPLPILSFIDKFHADE